MSIDKNRIIKIIGIIPSFLIFISSLEYYIYYSSFKIKIFQYLEMSEFIVSNIDSFILYAFLLSLPIIISFSAIGREVARQDRLDYEQNLKRSFLQRIKNDFAKYKYLFLLNIVVIIFIFIVGDYGLKFKASLCITPGVYIVLFLFREFRILQEKQSLFIPTTYLNFLWFATMILLYATRTTLNEADQVKNGYKYYGTTLYVGNDTIKSDSIVTYIGQTSKYLFLYDYKNKDYTLYPTSEIKKLSIKSKESQMF